MDIFYAQSNHNPEMHKYIFQGSEYIGQLDFWSATEIKEFGQLLGFECKSLVLDIGSGLGGPICYLSRTYGCNAIGVDACLQNVEISKERARSLKLEQKISFLFGDIINFDFESEKFDFIISIDSIVHIRNRKKLLEKCYNWLKPNGKFLIALECVKKDTPKDLIYRRNKLGAVYCDCYENYILLFKDAKFSIIYEKRYVNKRRDFSASALQWMDNNGQINGRESMEMIKVLSEKGYAEEYLFIIQKN